jgi:hypothetical protein
MWMSCLELYEWWHLSVMLGVIVMSGTNYYFNWSGSFGVLKTFPYNWNVLLCCFLKDRSVGKASSTQYLFGLRLSSSS